MTPIRQYKQELSKKLCCRIWIRRQLMCKFDSTLSAFLEDVPQPTYAELCHAFGTPETMAQLLTENVSPDEIVRFKRRSIAAKACITVAVSLFLLLSALLFYWKSTPIVTYDACYISEAS